MTTAIGPSLTNNFTKPKSFEYTSGSTVVDPNPVPTPCLTEAEVEELILQKIASFNKNPDDVNLELDRNPLDNIIRNEIVSLFNFRKISISDIQRALDLHSQGQDPSHDMSMNEHNIILSQARELEFITEEEFLSLKNEPNMFWFNFPEQYLKVLQFQINLPSVIPTLEELKASGIEQLILDTVRENPDDLIKEITIQFYTEKYINEILLRSEFIGYDKAQLIYKDPTYLMNILDKQTLSSFLFRLKPYLTFITDEKISQIMSWPPSQYSRITEVFTTSQIRLMIDKELDIKNLILKTLTLEEVQKTFNELSEKFKAEFIDLFTNEKMIELIKLTLKELYPEPTLNEIYQRLSLTHNINISNEKIQKIESYLNNY